MSGEATQYLLELADGHESAAERLFPLVYQELRRLAGQMLVTERRDHTLEPTALVHEAYMRLIGHSPERPSDRAHFCRVAARAMRQVLVDHARRHTAQKRGGGFERITLSDSVAGTPDGAIDLLALDDALKRLADLDERQARIVELRFFGGLTIEQGAAVMGISQSTIENDWRLARAWLHRELSA